MPERIDALVEQVGKLADEVRLVRDHYRKWGRRTFYFLLAIVIVQLLGGLLALWLVGQNRQRVNDIQRSRREVTLETCRERNIRNVRTKELVTDSEALRPRSKVVILALVDRLVPFQDCQTEVEKVGLDK